MPIPTLVVGGTHSGVGKTSVAIALMRAFSTRGMQVQPFKVGPDFIDPGHHQNATGRVCHNLDGWMLSRSQNREIFEEACQGADLAIVEGVMGLFDGFGAESEAGSTAEMAKWLGAAVILVINAKALGRSAAALISGYAGFDPALNLAGVICNQIGSSSHLDRIRSAVSQTVKIPILGGLPRTEGVSIPERHLGLWRAAEDDLANGDYMKSLAQLVEENLDLEALLHVAKSARSPHLNSDSLNLSEIGERSKSQVAETEISSSSPVRIGVARDRAFCFYYAVNLSLLERSGAELIPFSPLEDSLPEDLDGLYIGGGYPELYAAKLSENQSLRRAIAAFCQSGRPVYAECGGLMYLAQGLLESERSPYPFVGVLPFWTTMGKRVKLGYRQAEVMGSTGFFPKQGKIRGHRFHYSDIVDAAGNLLDLNPRNSADSVIEFDYRLQGWGDRLEWEGYRIGNVLASYVHLHFGSNPAFPQQFVCYCRERSL
ncbi:cobyrinate a,c-diamide synthase [Baaleninema simplex]|uniref:cobyrinate a,c-diamide synthase n=1 Tax=Baaleninema simplex TaxID=2862350 RepID=UPI0003704D2F|nr:cobyrinate a,c-diamide synthase [Baaleninema simplex]